MTRATHTPVTRIRTTTRPLTTTGSPKTTRQPNHADDRNEHNGDDPNDDDEEEEMCCEKCNHFPCWLNERLDIASVFAPNQTLLLEHLHEIGEVGMTDTGDRTGRQIHFAMYRFATHFIHGILGIHNRKCLPELFVHAVVTMFPASDGEQ